LRMAAMRTRRYPAFMARHVSTGGPARRRTLSMSATPLFFAGNAARAIRPLEGERGGIRRRRSLSRGLALGGEPRLAIVLPAVKDQAGTDGVVQDATHPA